MLIGNMERIAVRAVSLLHPRIQVRNLLFGGVRNGRQIGLQFLQKILIN